MTDATPAPAREPSALRAIFSRTFVAISLINMLGLAAYYSIFVVSTRYLSEVFRASPAVAGLATGIIVIGCLVGRFFTGSIVHQAGYRRVLFCGVLLYLAASLAYFAADSLALIFLVRFVSGVAVGIVGTVTGTIVAVVVPPKFHGRGIAYFSMSTALALCFGPFIGIALLDSIGYRGIFSIGSAMALFNLLLVALVKVEASRRPAEHHRLSLSDFIEPRLIPFSLLGCFVCLAWGNLQAFIAGYAHEYGVVAAASSFFLVYAVAILVSRPWSGKMYDMHGPAVIMYPAFVCLVLGLVLLWANLGGWAVLLSGVFAGLGFGNFTSVGQVSAISMVPRERYAQATSTFYVFFDLGIGVAPYLGGLILPAVGYTGIFGLNAVVVVLCIGGYWLLQRAGLTHRPTATGEAVRVHD